MGTFLKWLEGKKTYATIAIAFIIGGLNSAGVIDQGLTEKIWAILGFLGLGFLRAGVAKNEK